MMNCLAALGLHQSAAGASGDLNTWLLLFVEVALSGGIVEVRSS